MISFKANETQTFNLRAAYLIMQEDRMLFQRFREDEYWFLPGGRVEMMEDSPATIRREIDEEYGWKVKDQRLVWVGENLFHLQGTAYHEIGFYYFVQIEDELDVTAEDFSCREGISISRWIPIKQFDQYSIVPPFLKQATDLDQLKHNYEIKHFINREE